MGEKQLLIGPSTGWLYAVGINLLAQQKEIWEGAGANAVEFCLGASLNPYDERVASILEPKEEFSIGTGLNYRSVHLPDYQPDIDQRAQAAMARKIAAKQMAMAMLIHPLKYGEEYPESYYERLNPIDWKGARIRLAIENMDKNKPNGFLLAELENLVKSHDLAFVLDVQHAFEHDSSMAYAKDLFLAMQKRLAHLHVSGECDGSNHCLLHRARNAAVIAKFLGEIFAEANVPIVLEGEYQTAEDLLAEIEFIKKELGS